MKSLINYVKHKKSEFYCEDKHVRFVWGKHFFPINRYFKYKQCLQKVLEKKKSKNYGGKVA